MKKIKTKTKIKKQTPKVSPDEIAETYKTIYEALIRKGFTSDQAIQLMLSMARS